MSTEQTSQAGFNLYHDDPLYTVEEAAEYCKQSVTTINKWRREKKMPCIRISSDARFRRSDLNKMIDNHTSWGFLKGVGQ
jgi:excisionase family DNA binding protein